MTAERVLEALNLREKTKAKLITVSSHTAKVQVSVSTDSLAAAVSDPEDPLQELAASPPPCPHPRVELDSALMLPRERVKMLPPGSGKSVAGSLVTFNPV